MNVVQNIINQVNKPEEEIMKVADENSALIVGQGAFRRAILITVSEKN